MVNALVDIATALGMAFVMGWEILWALVLGFTLSGVVQAVVTKGGDEPAATGRSATFDRTCAWSRRRLVIMLLCSSRAGALHIPKGSEFHCRHGVRNGLRESRS